MLTTLLSLLGGGLGGLLRLAPEILKFFTAGKDQDHEFRMSRLQLEIDQARAAQAIDAIHAAGDISAHLEDIKASVAELIARAEVAKAQTTVTGDRWIDRINMTVRPFITYWWMILFTVYKLCVIAYACLHFVDFPTFIDQLWTEADTGFLSMILIFWFVGRVIDKDNPRQGRER